MTNLLVRKFLPTLFIFSMSFGLGKRNLTILNSSSTSKVSFNANQFINYQNRPAKVIEDKFSRNITTSSKVLTILPSTERDNYWIYAENSHTKEESIDYNLVGKWLIFVSEDKVDEIWEKIKEKTESNELGISAKVSTAKQSQGYGSKTRVICVYTKNHEDEKNVWEVREGLRKLGFTRPLSYKTDQATCQGIYSNKNKRVSKYYG